MSEVSNDDKIKIEAYEALIDVMGDKIAALCEQEGV
jgi:hypothetical protein